MKEPSDDIQLRLLFIRRLNLAGGNAVDERKEIVISPYTK